MAASDAPHPSPAPEIGSPVSSNLVDESADDHWKAKCPPLFDYLGPRAKYIDVDALHDFCRSTELQRPPPGPQAWARHPHLTANKMRPRLFDWMGQCAMFFFLRRRAYYHAIHLVDKFLWHCREEIGHDVLQKYGIAALFIAGRLDMNAVDGQASEFAKTSAGKVSKLELLQAEQHMLRTLDLELWHSSCDDAVHAAVVARMLALRRDGDATTARQISDRFSEVQVAADFVALTTLTLHATAAQLAAGCLLAVFPEHADEFLSLLGLSEMHEADVVWVSRTRLIAQHGVRTDGLGATPATPTPGIGQPRESFADSYLSYLQAGQPVQQPLHSTRISWMRHHQSLYDHTYKTLFLPHGIDWDELDARIQELDDEGAILEQQDAEAEARLVAACEGLPQHADTMTSATALLEPAAAETAVAAAASCRSPKGSPLRQKRNSLDDRDAGVPLFPSSPSTQRRRVSAPPAAPASAFGADDADAGVATGPLLRKRPSNARRSPLSALQRSAGLGVPSATKRRRTDDDALSYSSQSGAAGTD